MDKQIGTEGLVGMNYMINVDLRPCALMAYVLPCGLCSTPSSAVVFSEPFSICMLSSVYVRVFGIVLFHSSALC